MKGRGVAEEGKRGGPPLHTGLAGALQTDILDNSVADRYSYTLLLTSIRVCTPGDRQL